MKEQERKNNLVKREEVKAIQLSNSIDESDRVKKFTTVDITDKKDANMLVNGMQKPDKYLKFSVGILASFASFKMFSLFTNSFGKEFLAICSYFM